MIRRRLYRELDLVVHEVDGELTGGALRSAGVALYELTPVPRFSLWDLSNALVSEFSLKEVRSVQPSLVRTIKGREGGKTAVVAPSDVTFGVMRQYVATAGGKRLPFEQRVFRTHAEAMAWLGLEADGLDLPGAPG